MKKTIAVGLFALAFTSCQEPPAKPSTGRQARHNPIGITDHAARL